MAGRDPVEGPLSFRFLRGQMCWRICAIVLAASLPFGLAQSDFALAAQAQLAQQARLGGRQAQQQIPGMPKVPLDRPASWRQKAIESFLENGGETACRLPRLDGSKLRSLKELRKAAQKAMKKGLPPSAVVYNLPESVGVPRPSAGKASQGERNTRPGDPLAAGAEDENYRETCDSDMKCAWRQSLLDNHGQCRMHLDNGHLDGDIRVQEVVTVEEYLKTNASFMGLFMGDAGHPAQVQVLKGLPGKPKIFESLDARPVLSLGLGNRALHFHVHKQTWLVHLAGRKAWWLSHPSEEAQKRRGTLPVLPGGEKDPCYALKPGLPTVQKQAELCTVQPGEALYFDDGVPHATCNLDDFVLGYGAQGSSETWPPLHLAAHRGDQALVEKLLAEEAVDINMESAEGRKAIYHAVHAGHKPITDLLIEARSELTYRDNIENVIMTAVMADQADLVTSLAKAGAMDLLPDDVDQALHLASSYGHVEVIEGLIQNRASLNSLGDGGPEPIHRAATQSDPYTIKYMVERGQSVTATMSSGSQPLHFASSSGHRAISDYLLSERASANVRDSQNLTPLYLAAQNGHPQLVEVLAAHRANLNAKDKTREGYCPLHAASHAGYVPVVEALLEARAKPNAQDKADRSPVHIAAWQGHSDAVKALGRYRANLEAVAEHGLRPAHFAASAGHVDALDALERAGVDLALDDGEGLGLKPANVAQQMGHASTVRWLTRRGAGPDDDKEEDGAYLTDESEDEED